MEKDAGKYSILVIEDNPGDFLLIEDYLEEQILAPGIVRAKSFSEAQALLSGSAPRYDIIFLDLSLPDGNGETLVKGIVELASGIPVIILTGYTDLSFSLRSLALGISDYLLKDEMTSSSLYKNIIYNIERKRSEKELRQKNNELKDLSNHLETIREEERVRIAREIHDELGQQLTALKMDIDWISYKQTSSDEAVLARLSEMSKMSDGIIHTVRRISADLRPPIIDDLGLIAAMEWKCNDFEEKTNIPCSFSSAVTERTFDDHFSINIYRILQESLTNILRHAAASNVEVSLSQKENELFLEIRDDGRGIPVKQDGGRKTLGIIGMKERASLFGGDLTIENVQPTGTCVKLRMPLANEQFLKADLDN